MQQPANEPRIWRLQRTDESDVAESAQQPANEHRSGRLQRTDESGDLELDDNQLTSIESGAFSGLTNLTYLYLGSNPQLIDLNLGEADFSSLTSFDVSGNAISPVSR